MRGSRQLNSSLGRSSDSYELHSPSLASTKVETVRRRLLSSFTVRPAEEKDLYIARLESRVMELEKTVNTQKIQLMGLIEQKYCLHEICRRQQEKLSQRSDEDGMMIEELTRQVQVLRMERQRATEVMEAIATDKQTQIESLNERVKEKEEQNRLLKQELNMLQLHNETLRQQLSSPPPTQDHFETQLMQLRELTERLQEELDQKRHVERKFRMSLQEIQRLELTLKSTAAPR